MATNGYKIKCISKRDYEEIRRYFTDVGISCHKKKNKPMILAYAGLEIIGYYLNQLDVYVTSIKPLPDKKELVACEEMVDRLHKEHKARREKESKLELSDSLTLED